jgi:2,4-dienoyl-CoA reductase-like NADH-dependent reductase (Old Yellow Enzyme family)
MISGLDRILSPLTINGVELRNRVVRTAHGTNIGNGRVDDRLVAYHEARARGGVGLSLLEAASVHRTDTGTLRLHDSSCIADLSVLATAVHRHGMKVFVQLGHLGYEAVTMDGTAPWSASAIPGPNRGVTAHAMTHGDIAELTACFAQVAGWAREAGMDGVEIHAAHGYLLEEFLSPATNFRTDSYGGSLEKRARFTVEILAAVRAVVGGAFPVGVRVGPEAVEDGLDALDVGDIVGHLERTGLIDYVNVTYGSCRAPHKIIGAMHEPTGYELPTSELVTKVTSLPTLVTGRFRTLAEGERVLAEGVADLVGFTRATIADPDLVIKTIAGRADAGRPCIACNQGCVGGLSLGTMACTVNADVGFEVDRGGAYDRVDAARRVVIVGGGPAGMEAARVAAMRGHAVTVLERADRLGGAVHAAAAAPYRGLHLDIVSWFEAELERLGVDVRLQTAATAPLVTSLCPDDVVVATGARQAKPVSLAGHHDVRTPTELYSGGVPTVAHVVVVDHFGGYPALGAAEALVAAGARVTYITGDPLVALRAQRVD